MSALAPLVGPAGLHVARARHPATQAGRPDALALAGRWCERLRSRGAPAPEIGAALAATRGAWGVDRAVFAALTGVAPDVLAALEGGAVAIGAVPAVLLGADPFGPVLARLRALALAAGGAGGVADGPRDGWVWSPPPTTRDERGTTDGP